MSTDSVRADPRWVLRAFVVGYSGLVAFATAVNYILYADGSYFAFALASGHPWQMLWRDFPLRLGALLPTGLPAALLGVIGAPPWLVSRVYGATFLGFPLIILALTRYLEPKSSTRWQIWLIAATSTLTTMAFGFPTETAIAISWLFPLMAVVTNPIEKRSRLAIAMALSTVFTFSHEVAVLCAPIMLCAWLLAFRRGGRRLYLAILLGWWGVNWAVWWVVQHHFAPTNPLLVAALGNNRWQFFNWQVLHDRPLLRFGLLTTAILCALAAVPRVLRYRLVYVVIAAIAVWGAYYILPDTYPGDHYYCRTAIAVGFPLLAFFAVITREPPAALGWAALAFLAVQLVDAGANVHGWMKYRRFMVYELLHRQTMSSWEWELLNSKLPRRAIGFHWNWTEPYLSSLLVAGRDQGTIVIDTEGWYAPFTCESARSVIPGLSWIRRENADRLIADICDKQPVNEPYCSGDLLAGDVDGDGHVDLICRERARDGRTTLSVAFAADAGAAKARTWSAEMPWCADAETQLFVGDFNGDGLSDLLCYHAGLGQELISFGSPQGGFTAPESENELMRPWCYKHGAELLVGDFNGDGRTDALCHERATGALVLRLARGPSSDSEMTLEAQKRLSVRWCREDRDELRAGDIDGDGIDDLLCHRASDGHVDISYTRVDRNDSMSAPTLATTDWSDDMMWCNDPHAPDDEFWLHRFEPEGAAAMMCRSAYLNMFWIAPATRNRASPYYGSNKVRWGTGWCYGGGGRDPEGRHLIDLACTQRGLKVRH